MTKALTQPESTAYWKVKQYAAWLNLSDRTVWRMIESGEPIPYVKFGPRGTRIPVEAGKAYAATKLVAKAAAA